MSSTYVHVLDNIRYLNDSTGTHRRLSEFGRFNGSKTRQTYEREANRIMAVALQDEKAWVPSNVLRVLKNPLYPNPNLKNSSASDNKGTGTATDTVLLQLIDKMWGPVTRGQRATISMPAPP